MVKEGTPGAHAVRGAGPAAVQPGRRPVEVLAGSASGLDEAAKYQEERAKQAVRSLRAQATALNLLATEIETEQVSALKLESWAAMMCAYADQVDYAAERLRGEKP